MILVWGIKVRTQAKKNKLSRVMFSVECTFAEETKVDAYE